MINPPGGMDSGFLAVVLVDELIKTLEAKKLLGDAERTAFLRRVLARLDDMPHSAAEASANVIRQALDKPSV